MDGWKCLRDGNREILLLNGGESMDKEEFYFQKIGPKEFIKKILPMLSLFFTFYILILPTCYYGYWLLKGTGPFIIFPTRIRLVFYCILVTAFITKDVKAQQFLYRRIQEVPFIKFTENNLQIDRGMTQFPWGKEWAGTILIEWNNVSSIHIGDQKMTISFKNNQKKTQSLNLAYIENKDHFIELLKKKTSINNLVIL